MANNKKETKTLFNSSENSNFILNMTEEQYSKLASIGLTATCFLVFVFTAIAEIISAVSGSSSYSIAAAGLSERYYRSYFAETREYPLEFL